MRRAVVTKLVVVDNRTMETAPDLLVVAACEPWSCCADFVEPIAAVLLVKPDPDRDPDALDEGDESSSPGIVLKADTGTVVEPCCTTSPLEPMLTTSPLGKVAAGPFWEMTVPSIVATLETSAA